MPIIRTGITEGKNSTRDESVLTGPKNVNTVFVIGLPRSGTTLLAYMLAAGDNVLSLSEPFLSRAVSRHKLLNFIYFPKIRNCRITPPGNGDEIDFLAYLKNYSRDIGFSSLIIKETYRQKPCLDNTGLIDLLAARGEPVTAITRHPYDAAASTISFFRQLRGVKGRLMQIVVSGLHTFNSDHEVVEWFANNWLSFALWCRKNRPLVIRYEDLVRDPGPRLQEICSRFGIPFAPEMLNNKHPRFYSGMSGDPGGLRKHKKELNIRPVGRQDQLEPELLDIIRTICGGPAEDLGYSL